MLNGPYVEHGRRSAERTSAERCVQHRDRLLPSEGAPANAFGQCVVRETSLVISGREQSLREFARWCVGFRDIS